jgi:hypothetical protein
MGRIIGRTPVLRIGQMYQDNAGGIAENGIFTIDTSGAPCYTGVYDAPLRNEAYVLRKLHR